MHVADCPFYPEDDLVSRKRLGFTIFFNFFGLVSGIGKNNYLIIYVRSHDEILYLAEESFLFKAKLHLAFRNEYLSFY